MDIEEYEGESFEDVYAPDPRASQRVAAQRRAARHDTEPITPIAPPSQHQYLPIAVGVFAAALLLIGFLSYGIGRTPARPLQLPTDAPAQAFGADPKSAPVAAQDGSGATEAPQRTIAAYAAPDGLLLGPIEVDREIIPIAHFGTSWIQADVSGSGQVWLRARDVPDVGIVGPDLAPSAQTDRGLTVDQGDTNESPPAPPPAPATGEKPADDRAAHHAAVVARDHETHGQKEP